LPSIVKEPLGRYCPLGADFLTCSGLIQYALMPYIASLHALLKQTVACATSLRLERGGSLLSFKIKKGEPKTSA